MATTFNPPCNMDVDVATGVETFTDANGTAVDKSEIDAYAASLIQPGTTPSI